MSQPGTYESQQMLPELHALFLCLEKRKDEMLTYLETLGDSQRNASSSPSEWSPLQVMEHVVVVEEWMAGPKPAGGRVLMKGYLFILLGGGLMRSGLRTPTIPTAEPQGALDFAEIKQRWEAARNALAPKLAAVTQETRPLPIALHPIAGPLNAKQVVALLDVHLAYHWRHLPRIQPQIQAF